MTTRAKTRAHTVLDDSGMCMGLWRSSLRRGRREWESGQRGDSLCGRRLGAGGRMLGGGVGGASCKGGLR